MAGDWIPMRVNLADDPDVIAISGQAKISIDETLGKLQRMWAWFDQHTADGRATGATKVWLDEHVRCDGFAQAVAGRRWLTIDDAGLTMPNFETFLGSGGKKRLQNAKRQKNLRAKRREERVTNSNLDSNAPSATDALPQAPTTALTTEQNRTEQNREPPPPPPNPPGALTDAQLANPAGWRRGEEDLLKLGVAMARQGIEVAKANGCSPADVQAVTEHFVQHQPAWKVGALYQRLLTLRPDQDATTLWPEPSAEYHRQQAQAADDQRRQKQAVVAKQIEQQREDEEHRMADLESRYGDTLNSLDQQGIVDLLSQAFPDNPSFHVGRFRKQGLTADLRLCLIEHLASKDETIVEAAQFNTEEP